MKAFSLLIGTVMVNSVFSGRIFLSQCEDCCEEFFKDVIPDSNDILNARSQRCKIGCRDEGTNFAICVEQTEFCVAGVELRQTGVIALPDKEDVTITKFCVEGKLDESFAPTANPTPPTVSPTESPTETATDPPKVGSEADSSLPIIIGGVAGSFILLVIILLVFMPSRKSKQKKILERKKRLGQSSGDYSEVDKLPTPRLVLNPNGTVRRESNPFPNIHEAPESVRGRQRMSLKTLQDNNLLKPLLKETQFEAIFDFDAEEEDELSISKGEILEGYAPVNSEWWVVKREATGEIGMVPLNFMREMFPEDEGANDAIPVVVTNEDDIF